MLCMICDGPIDVRPAPQIKVWSPVIVPRGTYRGNSIETPGLLLSLELSALGFDDPDRSAKAD